MRRYCCSKLCSKLTHPSVLRHDKVQYDKRQGEIFDNIYSEAAMHIEDISLIYLNPMDVYVRFNGSPWYDYMYGASNVVPSGLNSTKTNTKGTKSQFLASCELLYPSIKASVLTAADNSRKPLSSSYTAVKEFILDMHANMTGSKDGFNRYGVRDNSIPLPHVYPSGPELTHCIDKYCEWYSHALRVPNSSLAVMAQHRFLAIAPFASYNEELACVMKYAFLTRSNLELSVHDVKREAYEDAMYLARSGCDCDICELLQ